MKNFITLLFLLPLTKSFAMVGPQVGAICPPGYTYDGANCFLGKPTGVKSFLYQNGFYHSGSQCQLGATYDSANCYKGPVPWNYSPFILQNGWYVGTLPHFIGKTTTCPPGFTYDKANCHLGKPPGGREAAIKSGTFAFKRDFYQNCSKIQSGAWGLLNPFWCAVKNVPEGYDAFVYDNNWYTGTKPGIPEAWFAKDERTDSENTAKPVCLDYVSNVDKWTLLWSDEFNNIPDNTRCYTSDDEMQCVYKDWWGSEPCRDRPASWTVSGVLRWSDSQIKKYLGLRNLNKCRWQVFDSYNMWENSNPADQRLGNYAPDNISISNGTLKMKTTANPGGGYDCGRPTAANPGQTGEERTRKCPYSGANMQTTTNLPWTASNSPSSTDPTKRFVGFASGYGRFEFKAKINKLGHGAWPSLWMFVDGQPGAGQGGLELDPLEFIGDLKGTAYLSDNVTYGLAHQTVHNWGGNGSNLPHDSVHTALPITVGEWYVFAVEWESNEVRYYLNNCLRKVIRDGDLIKREDGTTATFTVPKNQKISILIGNPAAAATWLPNWYRASSNGGTEPRADFKSTEIEVDYVRVYGVSNAPRNR